jgi:hypothetical protein
VLSERPFRTVLTGTKSAGGGFAASRRPAGTFDEASRFRGEFYACLIARHDELSELCDSVLCTDGPVKSPAGLTLVPEPRRGRGALYGGLNHGGVDVERLRTLPAGLPLPRFEGGCLVLTVDVSPWLRADAPCSADRLFCHVHGRAKTASQFIPGPALLLRRRPRTARHLMDIDSGHRFWTLSGSGPRMTRLRSQLPNCAAWSGDSSWPASGRPATRTARSSWMPDTTSLVRPGCCGACPSRWSAGSAPPASCGCRNRPRVHGTNGRPPKHGPEFRFAKPETWRGPAIVTATDTTNYRKAQAQAWDRVHPRLTHRSAWLDHDGQLPIVEGTLVRLKVEHLSKEREAPAVWLWSSKTGATPADVDRCWQGFLRRFDLEHIFRCGKQTLGWTTPKLRTPEAAPLGLDPDRRSHPAPSRAAPGRAPLPPLGETRET